MKKKLLASLLAICMLVSLLPVMALAAEDDGAPIECTMAADCSAAEHKEGCLATVPANEPGEDPQADDENVLPLASAVAEVNGEQFETLEAAVAAVGENAAATIKLLDDVDLPAQLNINQEKTIVLDMNGKTIFNTKDIWNETAGKWSLISVQGGADLTITGDGALQAKENDCYAVDVREAGSCTIEDGVFAGNVHAVYVHDGELAVNGGTFSVQQPFNSQYPNEYVLNCLDDNYKNETANIAVYGGTYSKFDPANCYAEGEGTNFCAEGYTTIKDGDNYIVKPIQKIAVAQIDNTYYLTLTEAIEAANNSNSAVTIALLKDIDLGDQKVTLIINEGKNVTIDFNGYTVTGATNSSGLFRNLGTLTMTDASGKTAKGGIACSGSKMSSYAIYNGDGESAGILKLDGIKIVSEGTGIMNKGTIDGISNCEFEGNANIVNNGVIASITGCNLMAEKVALKSQGAESVKIETIKDCTLQSANSYALQAWSQIGTIENCEISSAGSKDTIQLSSSGAIQNLINSTVTAENGGTIQVGDDTTLKITSGYFKAPSGKSAVSGEGVITIFGGYFTSDPSDYVAQDTGSQLYVVASDKTGYFYMVTTTAPTVVDPIVTEKTKTAVGEDVNENDKKKIEKVADKAQVNGISDAVTESAKTAILNQVSGKPTVEDKVVVEITVNVTAIEANLSTEGAEQYVSYEAKPVAKIYINNNVKTEEIEVPNSYLDNQTLIEVRLPIPDGLIPQEIMHIAENGARERFLTDFGFTMEDGCAVLHVKHFSIFRMSGQVTVAAKIGSTEYGTLQEAVNAARSGDTIVLSQDCEEPVSISGKSLTIDRDDHAYDKSQVTLGNRCTMSESGNKIIITYSAPNGGSSSSSGDYAVSVDSTRHGKVTVSPSRADKGDTVTITVKPDKGYELDELIVTDKNGDALKLTNKGDGKYTFTMPGSKVEIEATFVKSEDEPAPSTGFIDVPADAYYAEAVAWAVENRITAGTGDGTTFSPDTSCTRAQMMTFLWRAAGSPKATGANPFTDLDTKAYYYDAVLWAVENGITTGTGAATFSPDATVTRGQTVTFLYRNAGSPATSGSGFADVSADAYYADAVAWAVAEGITNGTGDNAFSPDAACTRAQIVTFLWRDMA